MHRETRASTEGPPPPFSLFLWIKATVRTPKHKQSDNWSIALPDESSKSGGCDPVKKRQASPSEQAATLRPCPSIHPYIHVVISNTISSFSLLRSWEAAATVGQSILPPWEGLSAVQRSVGSGSLPGCALPKRRGVSHGGPRPPQEEAVPWAVTDAGEDPAARTPGHTQLNITQTPLN